VGEVVKLNLSPDPHDDPATAEAKKRPYHVECAKPYLSLLRALDMMSRPLFN
jgi:hypothetical protein